VNGSGGEFGEIPLGGVGPAGSDEIAVDVSLGQLRV